MPDSGTIRSDLETYLGNFVRTLSDRPLLRLVQAFSAAAIEGDADVKEALKAFWQQRFGIAEVMLTCAVARGEVPMGRDRRALVEHLVAPSWLRALICGQPLDRQFLESCVANVLAIARSARASEAHVAAPASDL